MLQVAAKYFLEQHHHKSGVPTAASVHLSVAGEELFGKEVPAGRLGEGAGQCCYSGDQLVQTQNVQVLNYFGLKHT